MGKKGGSRHLKRLPAPKHLPISIKVNKWTFKPRAGPHPAASSIPLAIAIRDIFHYAKTAREAKIVISEGKITVDGVARRDVKFPLGIMDVVAIPEANSTFRVLPILRKGLRLLEVPAEERDLKMCRIENKTSVREGRIQLNTHDGKNILIKVKDTRRPTEDVYHTLDTLLVKVPDNTVVKHFRFAEGAYVIVVNGGNLGREGRIRQIIKGTATQPTLVAVEDPQGNLFQTQGDYVFVVGEDKPALKLAAG